MPLSVLDVPLFRRLENSKRILLAGAGGGFDVFAGLPLYFALRAAGVTVELANMSFTPLQGTSAEFLREGLALVDASTRGRQDYSPERYLCEFLESEKDAPKTKPRVFCFEKTGVRQLTANYQHLVEMLGIDAIVLIDGGSEANERTGSDYPAEPVNEFETPGSRNS